MIEHAAFWLTKNNPLSRFVQLSISELLLSFNNFLSKTKGFSVGDELGFPESLGNLEGSKRRALNLKTGANQIGVLPAAAMPVR